MTKVSKTLTVASAVIVMAANINPLFAQGSTKPVLDSIACEQWASVGWASLSDDGNYAVYTVSGKYNPQNIGSTLYVRATHSTWHEEVPRGQPVWPRAFTPDNRHLIVTKPGDTLALISLGDSTAPEIIAQIASYKEPAKGTGEWLAYVQKTADHSLTLRNLNTGARQSFTGVNDFWFNNDGTVLIIQMGPLPDTSAKEKAEPSTVQWLALNKSASPTTFWQGRKIESLVFDSTGTHVAFSVPDSQGTSKSLWIYAAGATRSEPLADSTLTGIDSGLTVAAIESFSTDDHQLYISLGPIAHKLPAPTGVPVDVWSYTDGLLQSQQLANLEHRGFGEPPSTFKAVVDLQSHRVIRLEQPHERASDVHGGFVVVHHTEGDADNDEWNWNKLLIATTYVESVKDGSRKVVPEGRGFHNAVPSPDGRFVVYYSPEEKAFMSYEINSGQVRNITAHIDAQWTEFDDDEPDSAYAVAGPTGWMKGDWVLLNDQNDMWQVDLKGERAPINITNGYGRSHHLVFRLASGYNEYDVVRDPAQPLLLTAFSRDTKDAGFFREAPGGNGDPEVLTMGPYHYEFGQKAAHADAYIVKRESASESGNYFFTTDFRTMTPITDVHPENDYNWMTSELMSWRTPDGRITQGVLFKPENFDPSKKYPVILYYYEKLSDELHNYKRPGWSDGIVNIPYMVSRGYLVFTPDIHFVVGHPMQASASILISAGQFLGTLPYVDETHMGLQGHSYGGYETNFVITRTSLFAAAAAASGGSDLFSDYGSLWGSGATKEGIIENRQSRMGATPWDRPQDFIDNSPLFAVTRVTTPLLMVNDKTDGAVPFGQGLEYFLALRRLGKRVWMLQYDGEDHSLLKAPAQRDYTLRLLQFFDHYLRGAPAPKWMVEGIPAKMKGIDNGFELEKPGVEPGPGLLAPQGGDR